MVVTYKYSRHFPLEVPPIFTQNGIFGLKIYYFLKKEVARGGEQTSRLLLFSHFSLLYR
jgi:hypothetical protein